VKEVLACGTYDAEENRLKPNGRRLPIKVVVLPAKGPSIRPVFVLAGGPGEAATTYAPELLKSPLRRQHDIVLVDQRGTGDGHRLDCPMAVSENDVQEYLNPLFARLDFWADCARRLSEHADLSQYSTPVAATDLDEIRQALGYDKIDLMGGSYASRHAMVYMKMFGEHVHAALLSGLVPLEIKTPLHHPESAQRALDLMVQDCEDDPECRSVYPDIPGDLTTVLRRLDAAPARVRVKNPANGRTVEVKLTRDAFAEGIRGMLYSAPEARRIPLLLKRALRSDFREVTQASLDFGYSSRKGYNVAMGLSANCNEDTERITPDEIEQYASRSFTGPGLVTGKLAVCKEWPDAWLPADHFAPFRSEIPVIVLSAYYDPVTPPHWGEVARQHFPNSVHVVIRSGHSLGNETCTEKLAVQLFRTGDPKSVDLSCAATFGLPHFPVERQAGERAK
jgi:pimeloyl-ACP methyl ester carboxylesterase